MPELESRAKALKLGRRKVKEYFRKPDPSLVETQVSADVCRKELRRL